jgi:hypothetical protein
MAGVLLCSALIDGGGRWNQAPSKNYARVYGVLLGLASAMENAVLRGCEKMAKRKQQRPE